ncbi:hypothetical protein, partial [Pseudomonas gessardii]|uniref:hypothetical protein n=1 Tax=Pseudomonas gessardii TaxID=78544 RepID=UPI001CA3EE48
SLRVCLRLPAYSASAKVICFIGKLGGWGRGILPNQKVFFRVSLVVFVEPPTGQELDDTKIVYFSLDDRQADGQQDLGYFKGVAVQLGCYVPSLCLCME